MGEPETGQPQTGTTAPLPARGETVDNNGDSGQETQAAGVGERNRKGTEDGRETRGGKTRRQKPGKTETKIRRRLRVKGI
jgi:hypothetical protein